VKTEVYQGVKKLKKITNPPHTDKDSLKKRGKSEKRRHGYRMRKKRRRLGNKKDRADKELIQVDGRRMSKKKPPKKKGKKRAEKGFTKKAQPEEEEKKSKEVFGEALQEKTRRKKGQQSENRSTRRGDQSLRARISKLSREGNVKNG